MKKNYLYCITGLLMMSIALLEADNTVTTEAMYKKDASTDNAYTVTLGNGGTVVFSVNATEGLTLSVWGTFSGTIDQSQDGAFDGSGLTQTKTVTWEQNCPGWGQINDCAIQITHYDTAGTECHGVSMLAPQGRHLAVSVVTSTPLMNTPDILKNLMAPVSRGPFAMETMLKAFTLPVVQDKAASYKEVLHFKIKVHTT